MSNQYMKRIENIEKRVAVLTERINWIRWMSMTNLLVGVGIAVKLFFGA